MSLHEILSRQPDQLLQGFLLAWHGVSANLGAQAVPAAVPRSIERLHRVAAVAPQFWSHNRLETADDPLDDGNHLVFYIENQGVDLWAIARSDREHADPPVWRLGELGAGWSLEAPAVSTFIAQMAVLEGVMGAAHIASGTDFPAAAMTAALESFHRLPLPAWANPGPHQFFASDHCLAFIHGPFDNGYGHIFIGAQDETDLVFLAPHLHLDWAFF